jgi:hypothetical protein
MTEMEDVPAEGPGSMRGQLSQHHRSDYITIKEKTHSFKTMSIHKTTGMNRYKIQYDIFVKCNWVVSRWQ